jgi:hypothetical protein
MADFITVGTFSDPVAAQLARARLEAEGIRASVVEGAGYNPLINTALGITVEVPARHARRAREILAELAAPDLAGDAPDEEEEDESGDVVRCPRCESEYCSLEGPVPRVGYGAHPLAAVAGALATLGPKRWRCQKCEHVWDFAGEGPKKRTRLEAGDPRPVFRLYRGNPGLGALIGAGVAFAIYVVLSGSDLAILAIAGPVAGWLIGRGVGGDVCSEPGCRAPLPSGAESCAGCKGTIAGRVNAANEHHSAAADVRRELASLREEKARKKAKKRKKAKVEEKDASDAI